MANTIHDEVRDLFDQVQSELGDLENVAGHDLMRLRDGLAGTLVSLRAAKAVDDYQEPETEAGAGAVEGSVHPEAVASEPQPETAEQLYARADREPDSNVREKVRLGADQARLAAEQAGTVQGSEQSPPPPGPEAPGEPAGRPEADVPAVSEPAAGEPAASPESSVPAAPEGGQVA